MSLLICFTKVLEGNGISAILGIGEDRESIQGWLDKELGTKREQVIDVLRFPPEGQLNTDAVDVIEALCRLNADQDDSLCETLENLLVRVFELGREFERSQQQGPQKPKE